MTKNWKVDKLALNKENTNFDNLINFVEFTFEYSDENITQQIPIGIAFDEPTDSFTTYEDLTEEIVLGWLYARENFEAMENNIIKNITKPVSAPPVFEESKPWD
jgi:hypothetical protein